MGEARWARPNKQLEDLRAKRFNYLGLFFSSMCSKNRKMSWWKDGEIRSKPLDPL